MSLLTKLRCLRPVVLLFAIGGFCLAGFAEDENSRRVKSRVAPAYPEIARKMGITGTVKLQLTIAPNGSVRDTKVIGGHPILVTAAVDAVKKWKFETAGAESSGTVEFKFDPTQ